MHFSSGKAAISLTAVLLGLTSVACVFIAQARDNTHFNGVYMGLSAGGLNTLSNIDTSSNFYINTEASGAPEQVYSDHYRSAQDNSAIWTGRVGFGTNIHTTPVWLGGEIFGNLANRKMDSYDYASHEFVSIANETQASLNNGEFGIDFKPGVLVSPTGLLYLRVGAGFNVLRVNTTLDGLTDFESDVPTLHYDNSDRVTALRIGAGYEQKVTCQFSFAADYIYSDYGSLSASGSYFNMPPPRNFTQEFYETELYGDTEVNGVKSHAFMIGFNYYLMDHHCN